MPHDTLESAGRALVARLGGHWSQGRGMCRCPAHTDRTPSLSVRAGKRRLLFHCFAGCDQAAVVHAVRAVLASAVGTAARDEDAELPAVSGFHEWARARAGALWDEGHALCGTPAGAYLAQRGCYTRSSQLRFHPAVPLRVGGALVRRPAMIARVSTACRTLAIQRCFLDPGGHGLARDIAPARRMLGRPSDGAVRLFESGSVLGLAEGIETALSASLLLRIPVWAVLGSARFAQVSVPSHVAHTVLLPDADTAGLQCARRACAALHGAGREVSIVKPWYGLNDWNDVLREEAGVLRARQKSNKAS